MISYITSAFTRLLTFVPFSYFRHWLNLVILHSVWTEFDLIPCVLPPMVMVKVLTHLPHPQPDREYSHISRTTAALPAVDR